MYHRKRFAVIKKAKHLIKKHERLRKIYQQYRVIKYTAKHKLGISRFDLNSKIADIKRSYYVAFFAEFLCNFKCSYCIQDNIKRTEYKRIDVDSVIQYLRREVKPYESILTIVGGEVTINSHFRHLIESLCEDFYITVTTNLGSRFFSDDFDRFIAWAKKYRIRWCASYHPEFMDIDIFIDRIKKMKKAGIEVGNVASVKTPLLTAQAREKLENAEIGFTYQTFWGIDDESGILLPQKDDHPDFDYERYKSMCGKQYKKTCRCRTVDYFGHARHLIGPDGRIYNCSHLLYTQKHPVGHIDNGWPQNLLDPIECSEYGHCNPCDFYDMEVLKE
jgi:MoaA/NifB/PqqE/SkfB family radical SAM enzyme